MSSAILVSWQVWGKVNESIMKSRVFNGLLVLDDLLRHFELDLSIIDEREREKYVTYLNISLIQNILTYTLIVIGYALKICI